MDSLQNCPICDHGISKVEKGSGNVYVINCPRCSIFSITHTCLAAEDVKEKIAAHKDLLSGLSRELHDFELEEMKIVSSNIDELIRHHLVPERDDIEAKAEKMLLRLKRYGRTYNQILEVRYDRDLSIVYAQNVDEFFGILNFLDELGLILIKSKTTVGYHVLLSAQGWSRVTKLNKTSSSKSIKVFVATWFAAEMDVSAKAICEAVTSAGYHPMWIKKEHFSDKIMDKALGEIRESKFLVVDLTGSRSSVFFEAGFAHGLGLDVIYVYRDDPTMDTSLDFYVKHYQCYKYTGEKDLVETVADAIRARIQ